MITFLSILQFFCCFLIVALVLLQPAKQGASAFSTGQGGPMGNAAGSTPLFKITMVLAGFLMFSSILISRTRIMESKTSAVDDLKVTELQKASPDEKVTDLTQPAPEAQKTDAGSTPTPAPKK